MQTAINFTRQVQLCRVCSPEDILKFKISRRQNLVCLIKRPVSSRADPLS